LIFFADVKAQIVDYQSDFRTLLLKGDRPTRTSLSVGVVVMTGRLVAHLGCALILGFGSSIAQEASTTQSLGPDTRAEEQQD
jgi:hypothetical protein